MSDEQKGVLILTHLQQEGSCTLGSVLSERDFRIKTLITPKHDMSEIDPLRPDLLVIMGGPIGVYQAEDYPFLAQEIGIVRARLEADLPTIGICLGAQIMASALGNKVYQGNAGKEVGWAPLQITELGMDGPTRHLAPEKTNMFHWHGDTFDLPEGCSLLASSETYQNQIFESGRNGLGLQCHPEVQTDQLKEWFVVFTRQITGENPLVPIKELRAQTEQHIGRLNTQAHLFFNEWLDERGL